MAFRMPRPVAFANVIYHVKLRGVTVTLPVDGRYVTVKIGDKVIASLRIKDPKHAKLRFQHAEARLDLFFAAMRADPKPLGYRDVVALSGDFYRNVIDTQEGQIQPGRFDSAQAE